MTVTKEELQLITSEIQKVQLPTYDDVVQYALPIYKPASVPAITKDQYIRASSISMCPRALYAVAMKFYQDTPTTPEEQLRFDVGNIYHDIFQDGLMQSKVITLTDCEMPYYKSTIRLGGRIDGKIILPSTTRLILEFKTINGKGAMWLGPAPARSYLMQIHCYFLLTGIREGIIVYWDLDANRYMPFYVQYDESIITEIIFILKQFKDAIINKIPPDELIPCLTKMDDWCNYKRACYYYLPSKYPKIK